jgi:hypothetical protein
MSSGFCIRDRQMYQAHTWVFDLSADSEPTNCSVHKPVRITFSAAASHQQNVSTALAQGGDVAEESLDHRAAIPDRRAINEYYRNAHLSGQSFGD